MCKCIFKKSIVPIAFVVCCVCSFFVGKLYGDRIFPTVKDATDIKYCETAYAEFLKSGGLEEYCKDNPEVLGDLYFKCTADYSDYIESFILDYDNDGKYELLNFFNEGGYSPYIVTFKLRENGRIEVCESMDFVFNYGSGTSQYCRILRKDGEIYHYSYDYDGVDAYEGTIHETLYTIKDGKKEYVFEYIGEDREKLLTEEELSVYELILDSVSYPADIEIGYEFPDYVPNMDEVTANLLKFCK